MTKLVGHRLALAHITISRPKIDCVITYSPNRKIKPHNQLSYLCCEHSISYQTNPPHIVNLFVFLFILLIPILRIKHFISFFSVYSVNFRQRILYERSYQNDQIRNQLLSMQIFNRPLMLLRKRTTK